jgi:GLPGLI family protein
MKNILIIISCLVLFNNTLSAQHTHFPKSGTIDFERKVNMYAIISRTINKDNEAFLTPAFEAYKKTQPQFKTSKSVLSFANDKTLFTPAEEEPVSGEGFFGNTPMSGQNNTIYTDFNTNTGIFQKKVFDELFLVKDSTRKIKWKITDETREIAGISCRRANAIMLDSVYVVAFYAVEIPVPGGPESFNGLPGMILGVALPHENISWFATKVNTVTSPPALSPPKKGKPMDSKGFKATLKAAFKDWGSDAPFYAKAFSL